jgi:N-sulfoglucosamine sulfohydrolase
MREAGYFTANVRQFPAPIGFKGSGKTDWNFTYTNASGTRRPFDSDQWADLKTHQPFFAQINFQETHRTFKAPKHADPAKVEIPPYYPDHPVTRADWAEYLDSATELDRKCGVILRKLEQDGLADNTVIVFFGDNGQAQVRGKQFCYESGLLVPLIIKWPKSFPEPKNFKAGTVNTQLLEAIDLAPTMLAIAGAWITRIQSGSAPVFIEGAASKANVSGVFPGPEPLKKEERKPLFSMQGRPFLGDEAAPPKQYVFGARDRCDETVFRFRTVRDVQYRYIRNFTPERPLLQANEYKEKQYPVWNLIKELNTQGKLTPVQAVLAAPTMPAEELFDLNADPYETNNLARHPGHQSTLLRLRGVLEKWIEESHDQGRQFEPEELVARQGAARNTGPSPSSPALRPPPQKVAPDNLVPAPSK